MKLEKQRCSSTMRQHCFSNRVINNWNSLPESVISSPSVYNNIIIMAGMAVVLRGWLPHRGEAQMAYNYCFPTRTMF